MALALQPPTPAGLTGQILGSFITISGPVALSQWSEADLFPLQNWRRLWDHRGGRDLKDHLVQPPAQVQDA